MSAAQKPYLNLDFESATRGIPWSWGHGGSGYEFALDTSDAFSGGQSYRIRYVNASQLGSSVFDSLPVEIVRGRRLRISGYMKTEGIVQGEAGLWLRVDGAAGTISLDNAPEGGVSGTTSWTEYVIDRDVSPEATVVYAGGFQFGNGTAWFDNFSISVDGAPIPQGAEPDLGEPKPQQFEWVRKTANAFSTPLAGNGLGDLWPVKDMVGDAHVVGLGEGTHGSREFFQMKHRMLEYLATEMGFTIFSIEANMPEAYRLNDYVLYGIGDPRKLLQGMYFWTWNTQEVLDMIEWIREFNQSGKGRIQFTGFDMQYGSVAAANVRGFLTQADRSYLASAAAAFALATTVQNNWQKGVSQSQGTVAAAVAAVHGVWEYLTAHRQDYLAGFDASTVDWAIQNARVMEQATQIAAGDSTYRDKSMAENIDWILEQNPGAKIVLWAHDYHISRTRYAMGSYLAANHGTDYVAFGQIFHDGIYNAVASNGLGPHPATPSFPGTVEYVLHSSGMPRLFLDMRRASPCDPGSSWLLGQTQYRTIGAVVADGFQFTDQLPKDYDVLIFFDWTSPSTLLPFK